jgi:ribosomal protein L4
MKNDEREEEEIEPSDASEPSEAEGVADKRAYAMRYISALTAKARATRFLAIDREKIAKAEKTMNSLKSILGNEEIEKIEKVYKDFLENLR